MSSSHLPLIEQIEALLPQTQCGKCQTPDCHAYAEAIAAGEAINRCVPGGGETIAELAHLLGKSVIPLDTSHGRPTPTQTVVFIREDECIGCMKCIHVCPVDAIVGSAKLMHTVIEPECSGCDLCIPACPVDCIEVRALPNALAKTDQRRLAVQYRQRYDARKSRLLRLAEPLSNVKKTIETVTIVLPEVIKAAPAKSAVSPIVAAALLRNQIKKAERQLLQASTDEIAKIQAEITVLQQELAQL